MKKILFLMVVVATTILTSCDDTTQEFTTPNFEKLFTEDYPLKSSVTAGDYTISLHAQEDLFVGYNQMYFLVKNTATNEVISDYSLKITPMMDMGMMMHTAPNETPVNPEGDMKVIQFNMVYIMPSTAGDWMLKGELTINEGDAPIAFDLPVTVVEKSDSRMLSFMSQADSMTMVFLTLNEPLDPVVGENKIQFGLYKRETMMSFPAIENYSIEFEPEMPTMGHGSPNNVNPTYTANGLYDGTVNFTMTGYWRINVTVKNAEGVIVKDGISFDVNF